MYIVSMRGIYRYILRFKIQERSVKAAIRTLIIRGAGGVIKGYCEYIL